MDSYLHAQISRNTLNSATIHTYMVIAFTRPIMHTYSPFNLQSDSWSLKPDGDFLPYNTLNCAGASQDFTVSGGRDGGDGSNGGGNDGGARRWWLWCWWDVTRIGV